MNVNAKTVLMFLAVLAMTMVAHAEEAPGKPSGSIWARPIKRFKIEDASLEKAVATLVELYHQQYPDDKRFSGYVIGGDSDLSIAKVAVDLRNVPFGEACSLIARVAGWKYTLHGRSVCFFPFGTPNFKYQTRFLPLSEKLKEVLELNFDFAISDVLDRLRKQNIRVTAFERTELKKIDGVYYLVVEGDIGEVETLIHLFKLLERRPSP